MSRTFRIVLAAGGLAALPLAPAILRAQAAPVAAGAGDSLAFPRQFLKWVLSSQGDSALAHAGPQLRESMQSVESVNGMAARIQGRFGAEQGAGPEVQFDQDSLKVYIVVKRYEQAPEPAAWVVAYDPVTKVVARASFSSLSGVKGRYPQAKLP